MKRSRFSVFVCCLIPLACKTSHFKGNTTTNEALDETPGITTTTPTITTTTTTGTVPAVKSSPVETSTSELALNQTCEKPVQLLMAQTKFNFEKQDKGCDFGQNGNLPLTKDSNGFLTARKGQVRALKLPENSEICSMTFESPMTDMKYDDFMILTIDNFVLFSSNRDLVTKQARINDFYTWDFTKVRGDKIVFEAPQYCVGAEERCKFPPTDTTGAIVMKLNYSEIAGIAKSIQGKLEVPIELIATGDNDNGADVSGLGDPTKTDCLHEPFDLTISLSYIKKPK